MSCLAKNSVTKKHKHTKFLKLKAQIISLFLDSRFRENDIKRFAIYNKLLHLQAIWHFRLNMILEIRQVLDQVHLLNF